MPQIPPKISYFMRNSPWAKPADSYTTSLPPDQEKAFSIWAQQNQKRIGPSQVVNDPLADYDYRGWWKENQETPVPEGHFIDKYKTPYHETFSNESQYANPELAPSWVRVGKGWNLVGKDGTILKEESE